MKNNNWLSILLALVFIAIPALIGFYFLLPDWTNKWVISYGAMWGFALFFIIYVIILTGILIYFQIISYDAINFNIPIAIVLSAIFVTTGLVTWARTIIIFILILMAFPINILTTKLKQKYRKKIIKKNKSKI